MQTGVSYCEQERTGTVRRATDPTYLVLTRLAAPCTVLTPKSSYDADLGALPRRPEPSALAVVPVWRGLLRLVTDQLSPGITAPGGGGKVKLCACALGILGPVDGRLFESYSCEGAGGGPKGDSIMSPATCAPATKGMGCVDRGPGAERLRPGIGARSARLVDAWRECLTGDGVSRSGNSCEAER